MRGGAGHAGRLSLMRRVGVILLAGVGVGTGLGSCVAGGVALDAALDRQALSLRWMHQQGYLVPPPPGTDSAMDLVPDWEAVVSELQETNLTTPLAAGVAFVASGICVVSVVLLARGAWMAEPVRRTKPAGPAARTG